MYNTTLTSRHNLALTLLIIAFFLNGCNQELNEIAESTIDQKQIALFNDATLLAAPTINIHAEVELIGKEFISTTESTELPYKEIDLEGTLSTQGVLTGAQGYVALYRKNANGIYQIRVHDQTNNANITTVYSGTTEVQSVAVNGDATVVVASMRHPTNNTFDVYLFEVGTSNVYNLSNISSKDETNVSISRDGSKVAWQRDIFNGNIRPYICDYDSSTQSCSLTTLANSKSQIEPSLSANGEYLALVRILNNPTRYQVLKYDLATSSYSFVAAKPAPDVYKDPSIDDTGTKVMYLWERAANSKNYVRINDLAANTASTEMVGNTDLQHPFMTADGNYLTFKQYITATSYDQIRTRNIATNATTTIQGGAWDYAQPYWMGLPPPPQACGDNSITVTGNQILTTQAEVDALLYADVIDGDLIIKPATASLDLSPLNFITEIAGSLSLDPYDTFQTEISGFDCLESIGGQGLNLYAAYNHTNVLAVISGFTKLISTNGITIYNNSSLVSIPDFAVLSFIGGYSFRINNNDALNSIPNFSSLTTLWGYFDLYGNDSLTSIGDFPVLNSIFDSVRIIGNIALTNLPSFPALTSFNEDLLIRDNSVLTSIPSYSNITSLRNFSIKDNDLLANIGGFPALETVTFFEIYNNDELTSTPDFPSLITAQDAFQFYDNEQLTSIGEFPLLSTAGSFSISSEDALTSLPSFPSLQTVTNDFQIAYNPELTNLNVFSSLNTIGGVFHIINNNKLTDVGSFPSLSSIGDKFFIWQNFSLTNISDFPLLTSVGNGFDISGNFDLISIPNFPILNSVVGDFNISYNYDITSLSGFDMLDATDITGTSTVRNNQKLDCTNPIPTFSPVDVSTSNLVNCP